MLCVLFFISKITYSISPLAEINSIEIWLEILRVWIIIPLTKLIVKINCKNIGVNYCRVKSEEKLNDL